MKIILTWECEQYVFFDYKILALFHKSFFFFFFRLILNQGCAIMGALLVPLSFLTVWEMTFSLSAATFAGISILLGIGTIHFETINIQNRLF